MRRNFQTKMSDMSLGAYIIYNNDLSSRSLMKHGFLIFLLIIIHFPEHFASSVVQLEILQHWKTSPREVKLVIIPTIRSQIKIHSFCMCTPFQPKQEQGQNSWRRNWEKRDDHHLLGVTREMNMCKFFFLN